MVGKKMHQIARILRDFHTQKAFVNNAIPEDNMKKSRLKRQKTFLLDLGEPFQGAFGAASSKHKIGNANPI